MKSKDKKKRRVRLEGPDLKEFRPISEMSKKEMQDEYFHLSMSLLGIRISATTEKEYGSCMEQIGYKRAGYSEKQIEKILTNKRNNRKLRYEHIQKRLDELDATGKIYHYT